MAINIAKAEAKKPEQKERFIGRVSLWNNQRRFGFTESPNPDEPDIFVHVSSLGGRQRLVSGEIISYSKSSNAKGVTAVDIVVIEAKAPPAVLPDFAVTATKFTTPKKDYDNEQPD